MPLTFSLRPGESLHIGPDVVVHFVGREKQKAKIAIEAPRSVSILRDRVMRRQIEQDARDIESDKDDQRN